MKNEFDEALYLVDGSYYFHLEEVKEGFRYAAYDADTKQFLASDLIRNEDILESPIRNPIAAARILAFEDYMWFVRMIKWTLKLFLKLLLFPVFIVTTTLTIILNVILHLGSFAAGLGLLVMLYCIISRLWLHEWSQAALATGMTAVGIGIFFGAGIIIALFEEANDRLGGFIRNA